AAAAYKLTDAFKFVGFYQTLDYDGNDGTTSLVRDLWTSDTYGVGGEYKVAPNTALKAMWMTRDSDADNADADMWVVGVEHKLDKAVRVYANYAVVDNDDNSELVPWKEARTANNVENAMGEKAAGFTVGLRYDF